MSLGKLLTFGPSDPQLGTFLEELGFRVIRNDSLEEVCAEAHQTVPDVIFFEQGDTLGAAVRDFVVNLASKKNAACFLAAEPGADGLFEEKLKGASPISISKPYSIGMVANKIIGEIDRRKGDTALSQKTATLSELNDRLRTLNDRYKKEMNQAREIQAGLLPPSLPSDERFDMAVMYEPLAELGGDWYFARKLDERRISLQISDARGKGLSAAFLCSIAKLAASAVEVDDPAEMLTQMNALMRECLPNICQLSFFAGVYDLDSGILQYSTAGEPLSVQYSAADKSAKRLAKSGPKLGVQSDAAYQNGEVPIEKGDCLLSFTDALIASKNRNGEAFGLDRVEQALCAGEPDASAADVLKKVLGDFDEFREERIVKDDMTVIALKRKQ